MVKTYGDNKVINLLRKIRNLPPIYFVYVRTIGIWITSLKEWRKRKIFQKYGKQIFRQFVRCAEIAGVDAICVWGTLLGVIRDQGIIPHDFDIDLAVRNIDDLKRLNKVLEQKGFTKFREFEVNGKIDIQTWKKAEVDIDLYVLDMEGSHTKINSLARIPYHQYKNGVYDEYDMLEIDFPSFEKVICRQIYNFKVFVPENYEEALTMFYGPGWKIPDPNYKNDTARMKRVLAKETYF